MIVELDGRVHHGSTAARDRDLDRDLDAATDDKLTLRIGYGQVFGRGCVTATKVGSVLSRRGWPRLDRPLRPVRLIDATR